MTDKQWQDNEWVLKIRQLFAEPWVRYVAAGVVLLLVGRWSAGPKVSRLEDRLESLKSRYQEQLKKAEGYDARFTEMETTLNTALDEKTAAEEELARIREQLAGMESEMELLRQARQSAEANTAEAEAEAAQLETELAALQEQLGDTPTDGQGPTPNQLKALKEELAEVAEQNESLEQQLAELEDEKEQWRKAYTHAHSKLQLSHDDTTTRTGTVSLEEALARRVTLMPPYTQNRKDRPKEEISVQLAVQKVVLQVGLEYNWVRSYSNTNPYSLETIRPVFQDIPCRKALKRILEPFELDYKLHNGQVVLIDQHHSAPIDRLPDQPES